MTIYEAITGFGRDTNANLDRLFPISTSFSNSNIHYPVASLGDVDNDSPVVKYLNHEILFTEPIVLSVLASPPYWEGIGQNTSSMSTYFGSSYGTTATSSNHLGFSLGMSVGFEAEVSLLVIKLGSIKTTAELEASFDWSFSTSHSITSTIAYNCAAGEDRVIFTTVPYDVYYYEIISDENPAAVGTNMSINIPIGKQTLSVARDFYNANNGISPDIDSSVFQHTIGNPRSYPGRSDMESIVGAAAPYTSNSFNTISSILPGGVVTVPQGSGYTEIGISVEDAVTEGFSVDTSVTVSVEAMTAGVVMGVSAGFNYGYAYDVTTVNGTTYGGVIAGIPSEYFNYSYIYDTGLFVYLKEFGGQKFPVVNYWVE